MAAGHLHAARKSFEQSLAIAERLAKADPNNSEWQRDLSVSYNKVGGVLARQNQRQEALQYLQKSLAIRERLVKLDPTNAQWKNDLDWVRGKIAELQR